MSTTLFTQVPFTTINPLLPISKLAYNTNQCQNKETILNTKVPTWSRSFAPKKTLAITFLCKGSTSLYDSPERGGEIIASSYHADPSRRSKLGHFETFQNSTATQKFKVPNSLKVVAYKYKLFFSQVEVANLESRFCTADFVSSPVYRSHQAVINLNLPGRGHPKTVAHRLSDAICLITSCYKSLHTRHSLVFKWLWSLYGSK